MLCKASNKVGAPVFSVAARVAVFVGCFLLGQSSRSQSPQELITGNRLSTESEDFSGVILFYGLYDVIGDTCGFPARDQ